METITAEVTLPRSVFTLFKTRRKELSHLIKKSFVLEQYREGKISIGKAAELLGMTKWEMFGLLKDRKIPVNYDVEEFEKDIETLKKLNLLR